MITSIIAILIEIVGIVLTIKYLFGYLRSRKTNNLKKAAISFTFSTALFFVLIIFVANQYPDALPEKEVVLTAAREAPLGGISLRLYADSTFDMGNFRKITSEGVYKVIADTLIISTTDNSSFSKDRSTTSFLIKDKILVEVKNSGINFLEIDENKIK